jgi:hypothetical protein
LEQSGRNIVMLCDWSKTNKSFYGQNGRSGMDDFESQFAAATERGRIAFATKPRARAARYESKSGLLIIDLANGATFTVPARLLQRLETATDGQIAEVEVGGVGFGLHWEALDADHLVESLLNGRFGSNRYMADRFGPDWGLTEAA